MKMFKKAIICIFVLVLFVGVMGCSSEDEVDEDVIAEYEGGTVTQSEFDTYLGIANFFEPSLTTYIEESDEESKAKIMEAYLGSFIGEKYLAEKIKDDKAVEEKVEETFELFREQYIQELGSEQAYNDTLINLNITEENLYDYLDRYYKAEEYFVKKEYDENSGKFAIATVSHILISNEARTDEETKVIADEVLLKLKDDGDFAALAGEYSDDPGSKDNGGVYEDVPVAFWVTEFQDAAITLPLNEISDLVKTDYGYHIIKVTDRYIPSLDDVSGDVRNIIFSEDYSNFMTNDLAEIIISTNLK